MTNTEAKKSKPHPPTDDELNAIHARLTDVAFNLCAIHKLCEAAQCSPDDAGAYLTLMRETARSSARAVDVCLTKIRESPAIGCFDDDLSDD